MAEKGYKRKLVTILSVYAEGYNQLMGEDEESTVQTLTTCLASKSFKLLNP